MAEGKLFLIYRIYTKEERQNTNTESIFYGWSTSKAVIKAFTNQRSKKKYHVIKDHCDLDEILNNYNDLDENNMINFVKLKSSKTKEEFSLFMTANEMQEAEKRIQRYFRELCTLGNIKGNGDYLGMFINLDEHYADALEYIGYRPVEVSAMYPAADIMDDPAEITGIIQMIENAYDGTAMSPYEVYEQCYGTVPGLTTINDTASKILYSIESFIKVLRKDL